METHFQALEVVIVLHTKTKLSKEPKVNISSWKKIKAAIEVRSPEGWGKVIDVAKKKGRFGLGFQPPFEWRKDKGTRLEHVPSIQDVFFKVRFREDEYVAAINDEDEEIHEMVFHVLRVLFSTTGRL